MGWDYELKEEAAKPKRNKMLVSGDTGEGKSTEWKEGEWDKKGRREQRGHGSARREAECLFSGTAGIGSSLNGFRDEEERKRGSGRS